MKRFPSRLLRFPKRAANALRILKCPSSQVGYSGWLGHQNLGDEALFIAIADLLSPFSLFYYRPIQSEIHLIRLLNSKKKFRAICLGGGTLIGRSSYLKILEDAISHDIPVFSFGTGVLDPSFWEEAKLNSDRWIKVLSQFEEISVRGSLSANILKEMGVNNVTVIGDPVIYFSGDTIDYTKESLILGVNVGIPLAGHSWGSKDEEMIITLAKSLKLLASKGWRFHFFGVTPVDKPILSKLAKLVGNEHIKGFKIYFDPSEFIYDASKCSVFLGMKLHATILAFAAFTPIIMLEYQPKCRDFMYTVGLMDFNIRTDNITSIKLANLVEQSQCLHKDLQKQEFKSCKIYKKRLQKFGKQMVNRIQNF